MFTSISGRISIDLLWIAYFAAFLLQSRLHEPLTRALRRCWFKGHAAVKLADMNSRSKTVYTVYTKSMPAKTIESIFGSIWRQFEVDLVHQGYENYVWGKIIWDAFVAFLLGLPVSMTRADADSRGQWPWKMTKKREGKELAMFLDGERLPTNLG